MTDRPRTVPKAAALAMLLALVLATLAGPVARAQAPTMFTVRVENISGNTALPGPFSPGVWATHDTDDPFFTVNTPDRGDGLVAIAEDGMPGTLAGTLATQPGILASGVFSIPVGMSGGAPIFPGEAYEFSFEADPAMAPRLSLATMLVQTNDIFASPDGMGIALFDAGNMPIEGDITSLFEFWDVGSEVNEAPGMGPNQAPRQPAPDTGAAEGVVAAFSNTTRGLPLPDSIADVSVVEAGGSYTVTVENISANAGALATPLAPVFYATHDASWQLFTTGAPDPGEGLESLAEDGSPAALVASHTGAPGTGEVGAAGSGPIMTGGTYQFTVTPTASTPNLTLASMVVNSNDAFLAFHPEGVALLDSAGMPRPAADVNADIAAMLAVWDAGTEANEVPGVGPNQAPNQPGPNTGPADPDNTVRLYADPTNDLAGGLLGGFVDLTITGAGGNSFDLTLTNTSDSTVYPGLVTPMLWALHDDTAMLFEAGMPASAGLESLAEDGDPSTLATEVSGLPGVSAWGVLNMPNGGPATGPLMPGDAYTATLSVDSSGRYLSIASMVVPSNDTFLAFGPMGIPLLDAAGAPRSDAEIAADIAAELIAWDAGTERNQAGAAGPDQAPRQAGPNTGADEGNSLVRSLADPVWSYPALTDALRVTITPGKATAVALSRFDGPGATTVLPIALATLALGLALAVGVRLRRRA